MQYNSFSCNTIPFMQYSSATIFFTPYTELIYSVQWIAHSVQYNELHTPVQWIAMNSLTQYLTKLCQLWLIERPNVFHAPCQRQSADRSFVKRHLADFRTCYKHFPSTVKLGSTNSSLGLLGIFSGRMLKRGFFCTSQRHFVWGRFVVPGCFIIDSRWCRSRSRRDLLGS